MKYFVSTDGNDSNNGRSASNAWKSFAKVGEVTFGPGDALLLEGGGVWNEPLALRGNGSPGTPVTVSSYGASRPLVRWGDGAAVSLVNGSHWIIRGLDVECSTPDTLYPSLRGVDDPAKAKDVPKLPKEGRNVGILAVFDGDGSYEGLVIEDNRVFGRGPDQASEGIVVRAVVAPRASAAKLSGVTIRGNTVEQLGWRGIGTEGPPSEFDSGNVPWIAIEELDIEGNTARMIGLQGICFFNSHDVTVRRNLVDRAGMYRGVGATWGPAGLWPWSCAHVLMEFNEVTGMGDGNTGADATGIDIDWSSTDVTVRHNHCYGNLGCGIVTMACSRSVIEKNRVEGNLGQVNLGAGQIGLCDYQTERVADAITGVTDLVIRDNLIVLDRNGTCALSTVKSSPGKEWEDVRFIANRIVFVRMAKNLFHYSVALGTAVHEFDGNCFYGTEPDRFTAEVCGKTYSWDEWKGGGKDVSSRFFPSDETAPSAAESLEAVWSETGVLLRWAPAKDSLSGVHHFNIFRGSEPGFLPRYLNLIGTSADSSFVDTDPNVSGPRWYKVQAEDCAGNVSGQATAINTER